MSLAAAVLVACGGAAATPTPTPSTPSAASSLSKTVDAARVRQIAADPSTSDHIRQVLADGVISFSEYESSVLSAVSCITDAGGSVEPGDPRLNRRGLYTYVPGWPVDRPELRDVIVKCTSDNVGILDLLWKELVSPSEQDIQDAMTAMVQCMTDAGLASVIPPSHSIIDFEKLPRSIASDQQQLAAYLHCAITVQDEYGLIGFAPYSPP